MLSKKFRPFFWYFSVIFLYYLGKSSSKVLEVVPVVLVKVFVKKKKIPSRFGVSLSSPCFVFFSE